MPTLAAVLASGAPERLYSGLSVLVSRAVDGVPCSALATFRALELLVDPQIEARVRGEGTVPGLSEAGRDKLAASLADLIDTAQSLDTLGLFACSASVETMAISRERIASRLDGVVSTPRFLRAAGDAQLLFV